MKILVTGVRGQLGYDVCKELNRLKIENRGVDIEDFDITDFEKVRAYILEYNPTAVIHCSAYTAVDRAEDNEELCRAVNVVGTENIARACKEISAKMMYISTDYVFSGLGTNQYEEDDCTGPVSVYGKTKLEGEIVVRQIIDRYFIVRISWVFGVNGNNFIKTMLRLAKEKTELNVVGDQVGSPTYTKDLAVLLCEMINTDKYGTYHATNEGFCSWAEFAEEIMKLANFKTKINYINTSEYPSRAVRPQNSRMSKNKLEANGFSRLPNWKDALKRYLEELKDNI